MFPPGVRSPPLRGVDHPRARRPCGASPGITREGVFSEGRTLCVRVVRPRECQDIAFPPGAFTIAPQSKRGMLGLARCFPLRACGARPFAGRPSEGEKALRGQTRRWRERRFSRRDALCASAYHGQTCAEGFRSPRHAQARSLVTHGDMSRSSQGPLCGRAEPAPPGEAIESEVALRGRTRRWRERWFSRRDALCASAL